MRFFGGVYMKVRNMALCGLFAALLAVCAWLAVPVGDSMITLQTFGVFLALGVLGGKRGSIAVLVYLLLGATGLPVFAGFRGGFGALLDVNGGYLWGFFAAAIVYWLAEICFGDRPWTLGIGMVLGIFVCYACGALWFRLGYLPNGTAMGMGAIMVKNIVPYLLPDGVKLCFAWYLSRKLRKHV